MEVIKFVSPFVMIGLCIALYFAPTFFAFMTENRHKWAIVAMNALLGWTVVFWLAALIWSLMNQREPVNG